MANVGTPEYYKKASRQRRNTEQRWILKERSRSMARIIKGSKEEIATSNPPGLIELLVQRRIPSNFQWSDDERHRVHDAQSETHIRYALVQDILPLMPNARKQRDDVGLAG